MKYLLVVLVLVICVRPNFGAHECSVIANSSTQCNQEGDLLIIQQNSQSLGQSAKFSKYRDTLTVHCFSLHGLNLSSLPVVDFSDVKNLVIQKCFIGDGRALSKIKENFSLKTIESLKIDCTNNNVLLTGRVFINFREVQSLTMNAGSSVTFGEDTFVQLVNLTTLQMNLFDIIPLPREIFRPLKKLETFEITSNGRVKNETKTLNFTFTPLANLQAFSMSRVRWPVKILNLLAHNYRLTFVEIIDNQIITLSENAFNGSSKIEKLNLTNNSITSLPARIFETQTDLVELYLSQNKLDALEDNLFNKSRDLEVIDLSYNKFVAFNFGIVIKPLRYLRELHLQNNFIIEFDFALHLGFLPSLTSLNLSHNEITKLTSGLECASLTHLSLESNHLKRFFVHQFLGKSKKNLTILLQQNEIESVDFRDLTATRPIAKLFIKIDDEITCNCHTNSLYNFFNRSLEGLSDLIYDAIEVSPNNSKCITSEIVAFAPETVRNITEGSLTCPLDFPHQKFCPQNCKCDRYSLDKALIIICHNISTVPMLPSYKFLKDFESNKIRLHIKFNGIKNLPSRYDDLNYNDVTEIYASYNHISEISMKNIPEPLLYLDLQFNRIRRVSADLIVKFTFLNRLQISNNPWNCLEATTLELVSFVKNHREIVSDFSQMQCSNLQYFLEIDVSTGYLQKHISIILFLFAISALIPLIVYRRAAISEWIFVHDKNHILETISDKLKLFDGLVFASDYDKVFARYVTAKLVDKPNRFKIALVLRNWSPDEAIPQKVIKNLRNAKRAIVILSDHFEESIWARWNHFNTGTRIIFILKGKEAQQDFGISNQISIKFSDPWFWDKLKHAMRNIETLNTEGIESDIEMQCLKQEIKL